MQLTRYARFSYTSLPCARCLLVPQVCKDVRRARCPRPDRTSLQAAPLPSSGEVVSLGIVPSIAHRLPPSPPTPPAPSLSPLPPQAGTPGCLVHGSHALYDTRHLVYVPAFRSNRLGAPSPSPTLFVGYRLVVSRSRQALRLGCLVSRFATLW